MEWQVVALIALAVLLIFVVRATSLMKHIVKKEGLQKPVDEARNILENRYALGELDDDEFAHRLQVLNDERKRTRQRRHEPLDLT